MGRVLLLAIVTASTVGPSSAQTTQPIAYPPVNLTRPAGQQLRTSISLTIDETGGCVFNRVTSMLRQRDRTLVVANTGNTELCFVTGDGRLIRRVGRSGGGPGEYRSIADIHALPGDSILVFDDFLRRLNVLAPTGTFVRSVQLKAPSDTLGFVTRVVALKDGSFIVGFSEVKSMSPRPDAVFFGQQLFHLDPGGNLLSRLGHFNESEHFVQEVPRQYGGVAYWDLAFGKRYEMVAYRDGFLGGDGAEPLVHEYTADGQTKMIHRAPFPLRPVTKSDIDQYRNERMARSKPERRAIDQGIVDRMPYPRTWPTFRKVLTDGAARIWLEQYPGSGAASNTWLVLDPAKRTANVFLAPRRFTLLTVFTDNACGVLRDDLDVESIRCYQVAAR